MNALVSGWVGSLSRDEVIKRCVDAEVPAGPLYSIADIVDDPQYLHRGTITTTESRIGPLSVPNVIPALSDTPGEIRWLGRELGSDTDSVLQELLARTPSEIATLRADGVI